MATNHASVLSFEEVYCLQSRDSRRALLTAIAQYEVYDTTLHVILKCMTCPSQASFTHFGDGSIPVMTSTFIQPLPFITVRRLVRVTLQLFSSNGCVVVGYLKYGGV